MNAAVFIVPGSSVRSLPLPSFFLSTKSSFFVSSSAKMHDTHEPLVRSALYFFIFCKFMQFSYLAFKADSNCSSLCYLLCTLAPFLRTPFSSLTLHPHTPRQENTICFFLLRKITWIFFNFFVHFDQARTKVLTDYAWYYNIWKG